MFFSFKIPNRVKKREEPMAYQLIAVAALLLAAARAPAEPRLITARAGTIPIILSAPHGGDKPIPGAPPRRGDGVRNFSVARDGNTAELTELIARKLEARMHAKPYMVIARFDRRFADVNRPENAGVESENARLFYRAYHQSLADFIRKVQRKWQRGLLLDIHGQADMPSSIGRGTNNGRTVELLLKRYGWKALTGPKSIFGVFADSGFDVVPDNAPNAKEDSRFLGGHIIRAHGSHQGNGIDAIQLEFGTEFREKENLDKTASVVAEAIDVFCHEYWRDALRPKK